MCTHVAAPPWDLAAHHGSATHSTTTTCVYVNLIVCRHCRAEFIIGGTTDRHVLAALSQTWPEKGRIEIY